MNPEEQSVMCWFAREGHCREKATVNTACKVEGTEIHLCQRHWSEWSLKSRDDDRLKAHCPRCGPTYLARREQQANDSSVVIADEPITGPLADAIDKAMHSEGILAPTRQRILRRLAADTDAYVAAVMSRHSEVMA
ncbi:MAG TPA: hypothetical protein VKU80_06025 [Planctomycetota bacterium]|nr:hypothetical protein [Planctomycetota bacterium]